MKKVSALIFISVITFSCTKNTVLIKSKDLQGTWLLKQYSGGFAGGIYKAKDDVTISFTSSKNYTSITNSSVTAKGNYAISKAGKPNYYFSDTLINLFPLEGNKLTYGIVLRNDSLFLDEGCCDRYTYLYTRKN